MTLLWFGWLLPATDFHVFSFGDSQDTVAPNGGVRLVGPPPQTPLSPQTPPLHQHGFRTNNVGGLRLPELRTGKTPKHTRTKHENVPRVFAVRFFSCLVLFCVVLFVVRCSLVCGWVLVLVSLGLTSVEFEALWTRNTMRLFSCLVAALGSQLAWCSDDLGQLVAALVEKNHQLVAEVASLQTDIAELQRQHDSLVISTTTQRHKEVQWRQKMQGQVEQLTGRRFAPAVSTQRRVLSSDTCGDPSGPALLVEGVCSCTGGLLVDARNVTQEMDNLRNAFKTTAATSWAAVATPEASSVNSFTTVCNPATDWFPRVVGTTSFSASGTGRCVASKTGAYVYTVLSDSSLGVVDVADATAPKYVGILTDSAIAGARDIAASPGGALVFLAVYPSDSLVVVNVSVAENPIVAGILSDSANLNGAYGVACSANGETLYVVANAGDSFAVIDVREPSAPRMVGIIRDGVNLDGAVRVAISHHSDFVFVVSERSNSLTIIDVQSATNPTIVSSVASLDSARALAVAPNDEYVYVTTYVAPAYVAVVDVATDIENPTIVGSCDVGASAIHASPNGTLVYAGSEVVNVSVPTQPTPAGSLPSFAGAISPDGAFLYASGTNFSVLSLCNHTYREME